jgi:predicted TIM-barrel fold metal-dependent hydrolase
VLDGTVGALVGSMDRAGIGRSVLASIATAPKQVDSILRWSLKVAGERIIPFASVHPECADAPGQVRRIARAGLRGIKLHPMYQGFFVDEPAVWPLYEAIAETGLVLLLHAGRDIAFPPDDDRADPERILRVHRAFPQMPIIAAHMGGWMKWSQVRETLAGTDVYLETSYAFGQGCDEEVRRILITHSPERVLFGTDSPWRDQMETVKHVRAALSEPDLQELVLHRNAERLLGLDHSGDRV